MVDGGCAVDCDGIVPDGIGGAVTGGADVPYGLYTVVDWTCVFGTLLGILVLWMGEDGCPGAGVGG